MVQLSHLYMTTGNAIDLTIQTFISQVMSLLFNMLSMFVIAFLPKSKRLLLLWLHYPSTVILEIKKIVFFPEKLYQRGTRLGNKRLSGDREKCYVRNYTP